METVTIDLNHYNELRDIKKGIQDYGYVCVTSDFGDIHSISEMKLLKKVIERSDKLQLDIIELKKELIEQQYTNISILQFIKEKYNLFN